ncbi:MAG: hypothetical protein KAH23_08635, partial [Kiritimatiellae bacterium]|nr:hypothetical protein [Kiritimatiellia bacterium]
TTLLQIADKENKQITFRSYSIRFDAGDHVIKMHSNDAMCAPYQGMEESIFANENYRRTIGKLTLQSPSGVSTVLDSNDLGLYLIVLVRDGCNGSSCSINGGPSWLRLAAQDMIDNGILKGMKYLYIGDQPQSFTDSLKLLEESQASKCFVRTEPVIKLTTRDWDSGMLLYKSGILHSVPSVYMAPDENNQFVPYEVEIEIQKWLINNLGSNKSLQ